MNKQKIVIRTQWAVLLLLVLIIGAFLPMLFSSHAWDLVAVMIISIVIVSQKIADFFVDADDESQNA